MKPLALVIEGRGDVRGHTFTQIKKSPKAYLYEVTCADTTTTHYEVFKHRENKYFNTVTYPSSKMFGITAWTTYDKKKALELFKKLSN